MIEDTQTGGEEPKGPLMTPEAQKKFLYAAGVLILMGASFFAGRFSVQPKSPVADPASQFKLPTPAPVGTPVPVVESSLTMINFTGVAAPKKAAVMADFNSKKCACNCGMTEAECILKDPNCPYWKDHVNGLQKALGNGKKADLSKGGKALMPLPQGAPNGLPAGMTGMGSEMKFPSPSGK